MYRVVKELNFCYGHRLLDYQGKCAHPHGHNGRVEIEFGAQALDKRGMVIDFVDIKAEVKRFLDEELDHQMLLRRDDPLTKLLQDLGEPVFVMEQNPTAENIAKLIYDFTASRGFPIVQCQLWETPHCFATYQAASV